MQTKHIRRKRIGNYELLHEIGEGGMARLYLARHRHDGRRAAIKILHTQIARDESFRKRFMNEARAVAAIQDPCVVRFYECGDTGDGNLFMAMEYIDGEPLDERLNKAGQLPVLRAMAIARQVAGALSATHRVGIIHRDLKPGNIMLVKNGSRVQARLLDFGIAKFSDQANVDHPLTMPGMILGTPYYMSPEQCVGSTNVDHRADIYSLGVILYQMLTGQLPFGGNEPTEIIAGHINTKPVSLRSYRREVSVGIEALVMRCLAKKPVDRFQTAGELREALARAISLMPRGRAGRLKAAQFDEAPTTEKPRKIASRPQSVMNGQRYVSANPVPERAVVSRASPGAATVAAPPAMMRSIAGSFTAQPEVVGPPQTIAERPGHVPARTGAGRPGHMQARNPNDVTWSGPGWSPELARALSEAPPEMPVFEGPQLGIPRHTVLLPPNLVGSAFGRGGYVSRALGIIALPLLALVLVVGVKWWNLHESAPNLVGDFQKLGAIACIECEGDEVLRRSDAGLAAIESIPGGTPTNLEVMTFEADDLSAGAAVSDTASESANKSQKVMASKRAARSAKSPVRSGKSRRDWQRARRLAKQRRARRLAEQRARDELFSDEVEIEREEIKQITVTPPSIPELLDLEDDDTPVF